MKRLKKISAAILLTLGFPFLIVTEKGLSPLIKERVLTEAQKL